MHKVDLPCDTKEAAKIARRRRLEEERKQRIFNPKFRIKGIDVEAIREQIREKNELRNCDQELDKAYGRAAARFDQVAQEIERRVREDRKNLMIDIENYRANCQRFEDRREFDLNDPNYLRNQYPARLHDEDQRCGPASIQKFEGEDPGFKERITTQVHQNKRWLEFQMREKKSSIEFEAKADELHAQRLREWDLRNVHMNQAQAAARRAVREATDQFNMSLAHEVHERRNVEKLADEEASLAHIVNQMQSEMLTETTDCTSIRGPHHTSPQNFRGYSEDRLVAVRQEQREQMIEKLRKKEEETAFKRAWDRQQEVQAAAALIIESSLNRKRRDLNTDLNLVNLHLAREQKLRQDYYRSLNCNIPTDEYFAQWNTTTR